MKEIIEMIAKSLVDQPNLVTVSEIAGFHTSIFKLKVAPEDIGKVIGKQGRTASAIRTIISAAAMKVKTRAVLEILDRP